MHVYNIVCVHYIHIMCIYTCVFVRVHVYVCLCLCACILCVYYMHGYAYVCIHIMYMCVYCMYMCLCLHVCMRVSHRLSSLAVASFLLYIIVASSSILEYNT